MIVEEVMRRLAKSWDTAVDRGDAEVLILTTRGSAVAIKDCKVRDGKIYIVMEEQLT